MKFYFFLAFRRLLYRNLVRGTLLRADTGWAMEANAGSLPEPEKSDLKWTQPENILPSTQINSSFFYHYSNSQAKFKFQSLIKVCNVLNIACLKFKSHAGGAKCNLRRRVFSVKTIYFATFWLLIEFLPWMTISFVKILRCLAFTETIRQCGS